MKLDAEKCRYTLVIAQLKPNTLYTWKITIDNSWNRNYGCGNGNCQFKANADGRVRLVASINGKSPVLTAEAEVSEADVPCSNPYKAETVRAVGVWSNFAITVPQTVMSYIDARCEYSLIVKDLEPKTAFKWQVVIGGKLFACDDSVFCSHESDADGSARLVFDPEQGLLSTDFDYEAASSTPATSKPTPSSTSKPAVVTAVTTPAPPTSIDPNPVKECLVSSCPACNNGYFGSKSVKAVGDWALDAGSPFGNWSGAEHLGLMVFEKKFCKYTLVLNGLQSGFKYEWKLTIDNSFKENYGEYLNTFLKLKKGRGTFRHRTFRHTFLDTLL
jgi:hypothetical protein